MGNCCSGQTVDNSGDIRGYDSMQLSKRMTARQLALLIKIQANIRGFLTRKRIRAMQINAGMGMGGYTYNDDGEIQQDYDNQKVQQIREELGEFDYDEETNHGDYPVEYRPMVELENHARYEGEWIVGKDIR